MDSFSTEEGSLPLPDQQVLYTMTWKVKCLPVQSKWVFSTKKSMQPESPTKALVVFLHGFSDHINRFSDFFSVLASQGIESHGFDQRGWGRSVRSKADRGLTGPTSTVMVGQAINAVPFESVTPVDRHFLYFHF